MLGNEVRHFKDSMVWERSHQLFLDVVRDIESFKKDVVLKIIIDQIIRSIGSKVQTSPRDLAQGRQSSI